MKVAIYTRVSTKDQARGGFSLQVQKEALLKYAESQKHEVYRIYEDDGYSGYSFDRPALKQLIKDAKHKKFDVVIVYKLDRFARNNRILLNLVHELDNMGVGFLSATEAFDSTSTSGKLALSMLGTIAQFERDRIIERVVPGMKKGVEKGNWQGARYAPYGYSYNKNDPVKILRVVKEEEDIIKMIYMMYLSGQSTTQIAGYLYKKAYKTRSGGKFNTKLVNDILKNQIYLGKIIWNTHHYDKTQKTLKGYRYIKNDSKDFVIGQGKHSPIITQEDYDAVQRKLESNRKGMGFRKGSEEYPLTGIIVCGKCGHNFQGCLSTATREEKKTKSKRRYYRCCGRSTHYVDCKNSSVRSRDIENVVYAILETVLSGNLDEARLRGLIKRCTPSYSQDIQEEIAKLREELNLNIIKQSKLSKIYTDGLLAPEAYKQQILPLRDEEQRLKNNLQKLELSAIQKERSEEYLKMLDSVVSHFEAIEDKMDYVGKKWLLRIVFKSITIEDGKIKDFELFEPFDSLYKGVKVKCQLQENKRVVAIEDCVSTYAPSDGRWLRYRGTMEKIAEALVRLE